MDGYKELAFAIIGQAVNDKKELIAEEKEIKAHMKQLKKQISVLKEQELKAVHKTEIEQIAEEITRLEKEQNDERNRLNTILKNTKRSEQHNKANLEELNDFVNGRGESKDGIWFENLCDFVGVNIEYIREKINAIK